MNPNSKQMEEKCGVEQSYSLAEKAETEIEAKNFSSAIELLSSAIALNANDYRFFINRSYCYENVQKYFLALKDAKRAIKMNREKSKCYFRKGKALLGLRMFSEAETAFLKVIELEGGHNEKADAQLFETRVQTIQCLGFSNEIATLKASQFKCVADIYANRDDISCADLTGSKENTDFNTGNKIITLNVTNPFGWKALFVTNVSSVITTEKVNSLFSKYGSVIRVTKLNDSQLGSDCSSFLIHYDNPDSPKTAMAELQGAIVDGINKDGLRICYRPTEDQKREQFHKRLDGKECYYWRTTGCTMKQCKRVHSPGNAGVDLQPWMQHDKRNIN